jgi:hypothetical protein
VGTWERYTEPGKVLPMIAENMLATSIPGFTSTSQGLSVLSSPQGSTLTASLVP